MDWKGWTGKRIFVKLTSGDVYTGKVIDVDISRGEEIWFTIIDIKNDRVSFSHKQIAKIVEEKKNDEH